MLLTECAELSKPHNIKVVCGIMHTYIVYMYIHFAIVPRGGYVNLGIFNNQLDLSRGINLQIRKEDSPEDYLFYYFLVEIFQ